MADAKKCDICGKFYMPSLGFMADVGYHLLFVSALTAGRKYDLCPSCEEKLDIFVKSLMEENND